MPPLYHPITQRQLDAITSGSGSYLFVGANGSGRKLAALNLSKRLNCLADGLDNCAICININRGSFPDLKVISTQAAITLEDIHALQLNLSQRPFSSSTSRLIVVDASVGISREAQNRLLKSLEEPPAQTIMIMLTSDTTALLETVVSRCRVINFSLQTDRVMGQYLAKKLGSGPAEEIMALSPETIGLALRLASDSDLRMNYERDLNFAKAFQAASLFERLAMVQPLKLRPRVSSIVRQLARLSSGNASPVTDFSAYEEAEAMLVANVGPRAVMETLALVL